MRKSLISVAALSVMLAPAAFGQVGTFPWSDDFESYAAGSGLAGQGGWSAWGDDATWDSQVSSDFALSGSNSVNITGNSDTTMVFEGIDCGVWTVTAHQYIPVGFSGTSYFILLNSYDHYDSGVWNWSTQVNFDAATGLVTSEFEDVSLAFVTGEWVEIRVEIDTDADVQDIYYGGTLLSSKSWIDGVSGGGNTSLQCMDLFANGASPVYYDDCSVDGANCDQSDVTLDVSTLIGGADGTFDVTGAEPGAKVAIVYGLKTRTDLDATYGNFCVRLGVAINLSNPMDNLVGQGTADGLGDYTLVKKVPVQASGMTLYFQAFQDGTCPDPSFSNIQSRDVL